MSRQEPGARIPISGFGVKRTPKQAVKSPQDDQLQRIEAKLDQILAILGKTA